MAKRRFNAKKIAQTPSLKRNLAMIVAEHHERDPQLSLTNLLAYGHRGYISYSEDELCKLFDKIFTKQLEDYAERKKRLEEELAKATRSWQTENSIKELQKLEEHISKFKVIANEIFEEKFLL